MDSSISNGAKASSLMDDNSTTLFDSVVNIRNQFQSKVTSPFSSFLPTLISVYSLCSLGSAECRLDLGDGGGEADGVEFVEAGADELFGVTED